MTRWRTERPLGRGPGGQRAQTHRSQPRLQRPQRLASVFFPGPTACSGVWRCWHLGWACAARASLAPGASAGAACQEVSGWQPVLGPVGVSVRLWSAAPPAGQAAGRGLLASSVCPWQAVGLSFPTSPGAAGWQCFRGNERATTRFPSLCLGQVCKCSAGRVSQPTGGRGPSTEQGWGRMFRGYF